jgi:hypothetical protein
MESGATPVLRQLKVYLHWRGFHPDQGRHLPKTKIDSYSQETGDHQKQKPIRGRFALSDAIA